MITYFAKRFITCALLGVLCLATIASPRISHNLADAGLKLKLFQHYYNQERPHSALGYVPPAQFAQQIKNQGGQTQILVFCLSRQMGAAHC